jgi:2-succinyl-6-hydroxy-2,4-cyclohexadiene-1-carboxylate synthase
VTPGSTSLVTLHGFTGSPASWRPVTDPVVDSFADIVHLPLLGHDPALPPGAVSSFDGEADRVASEVRRAAGGPVVLAGYSLGARVALVTALRHPGFVARLVLVGGHPGLRDPAERAERRAADGRWIRLLETDGIDAFVDRWQSLPLWTSQRTLPVERLDRQRAQRLGHDPAGLAASLAVHGLAEMPDCWPRLGELAMPVDLVVGARDEKFTGIAERMLDRLPHAALHIVADSGHNPLLEQPEALAGILTDTATVRTPGRVS